MEFDFYALLTPEQRENCMKLGESLQKWAEKERHPGWQGH